MRRWFQFSLATMLWTILTVTLACVAIRESRERRQLEHDIDEWAQQRMYWFEQAQQLQSRREERDERLEQELRAEWESEMRDLSWVLGLTADQRKPKE